MAEIARTVITALENLSDAVSMSVIDNQAQFDFTGRATTDPSGGGAVPTHCLSGGMVDEMVIQRYEMDPRFFVSEHTGRNWVLALADHNPVLYRWIDPNAGA